jgi:hypothetical protein
MADTPERRKLSFKSLDEAVADAERLALGEVRTTGQHSFGQILEHLARSIDMATGRVAPPPLPVFMRIMLPFIRGMILKGPVKPGVKLPKASEAFFWRDGPVDVQEALAPQSRTTIQAGLFQFIRFLARPRGNRAID